MAHKFEGTKNNTESFGGLVKLETGLNRTGLAILWTFIANLFQLFILEIERKKNVILEKKPEIYF